MEPPTTTALWTLHNLKSPAEEVQAEIRDAPILRTQGTKERQIISDRSNNDRRRNDTYEFLLLIVVLNSIAKHALLLKEKRPILIEEHFEVVEFIVLGQAD